MTRNANFFPKKIRLAGFIALAALAAAAAQASCTPPASGLVAWWQAEGNASDSASTNHGSLSSSGATYSDGKVGQGFRFNGTNGYASIPDSSALKPANVTVEAWVWLDPSVSPGTEVIVFKKNSWNFLFEGYNLAKEHIDNGNGTFTDRFSLVIANTGSQVITRSTTAVQRGVWYHVAGTYDGNKATIYVNGVAEASSIAGFALDYGTRPVFVGATGEAAPYDNFLAGIIDEASIYNRALATNEIAAIYNAGSAGKCASVAAACTPPASGLAAWWSAEGNASDSINGNNGSPAGALGYTTGKVGQSFVFDGSTSYIPVPASPSLNIGATGSGVTIEGWVKPNFNGTPMPIVEWDSATSAGLHLWVEASLQLYGNVGDTLGNAHGISSANGLISTNSFQHVALTYDKASGSAVIYRNGIVVATNNFGTITPQTTYPMNIGRRTGEPIGLNDTYNGLLDELALYNRALSQAEIQAIYNAGSAGKCVPAAPACITPASGLISWWPGEGSATDVIGGNTGTWAGTGSLNSYGSGMVGQEFVFDGTHRDRVNVGNPANLQLQNFTIEAWIKRASSTVASLDENFQDGSLAGPDGVVFGWGDGGYSLTIADDGKLGMSKIGVDVSYAPPAVTNTNWHHLAVTKTGTQLLFYVDGVTQPSPTINPYNSIFTFTSAAAIGSRGDGGGNSFYGKIDELAIYNRALSSTEIAAIYNAGSAGKCVSVVTICTPPASGIVGWWPAEANANDVAGTNHGTLQGGLGFASGEVSQAFNFNPAGGSGTAVFIPASSSLDVGAGAGFTLETWIKPTDVTQPHPLFEWNDLTYWGVHFNIEPGQPFNNNPGPGELYANIPDSNGTWHQLSSSGGVVLSNVFQHVALTYDKTSGLATIYRNGQIVGQQNFGSFTPRTAGRALYLGRRPAPGGEQATFAGAMDEPAVYNRALSSNEISAIYLAGSAGKCSLSVLPPACTPPPSGLAGWWEGEGNANDKTGVNNGALFGGATYATGKAGQGFRFDGTNGFLQIPDSDSLKPANVTCEAWVWLDPNVTNPRNEQVFFKRNTWSAFFEDYSLLKVDVDNGNGTYTSRFQSVVSRFGNQVVINSTTAVQRGVWYHVAMTYDGNTLKLFINGVQENSAVAGFPLDHDTQPVCIGSTGIPGVYVSYLAGIIDEPAIYNRALSTNEIAAIYNAGSAGKCGTPGGTCTPAPANLVAWLRAEGNLNDSAGTNHGTQTGGVAYSSGEAGQGFYFNGSSQIKLSASPALNVGTSGGLTLETWIRPGHFTLYEPQFVFEWNDGAGNGGAQLLLSTDHGVYGDGFGNVLVNLVDTLGNSHALWTATNVIVTNALQHVALTYDKTSGNAVIYVNGLAAAGTNLGSFTPQTSYDFYLGNRVSGPFAGSYFNGQLDEPSIYNRALSVSEIQAIYNAGSAGKCVDIVMPVAVTLLNVDFGAGTNNGKTGFAAAGVTTNDFWNFYTRDDGAGGWRTFGSLVNLQNFDGSVTAAGLTVDNAPGAWGSTSTDPMYAGYIYPFNGGNVTVTITNLPAGTYDVLPYSPNGNFDVAVGAIPVGAGRTCIENPVVNPPAWQPGVQYVRFTNVVVNAGQPLVLTVHPGVGDSALISGLQLALSSFTNALPPSPVAPFITLQPTNITVLANNSATFSVTAQGTAPLFYQWRFNGTNIAGATGAPLTLSNVQPALAGNYSVLVSNFVGVVASSNAVLNVLSPPVILSQTPSQVVLLGNPATFSVTAGGTAPLSYFWSRNSVLIPGATNFFYTLNNAQFVDSGKKFSCLVSNAYGLASSTNASLKVINTISNDLCSGAVLITSASYTNTQTTAPASSYGDPLPGCVDGFGNGVWYQFTAPVGGLLAVDTYGSDFDTGLAIYTGGCGSLAQVDCNDDTDGVTSALTIPTTAGVTYYFLIGGYNAHVGNLVFHLNHFTPPAFDVQPTNLAVIVSSNGNFSATLSGTLPMRLQWYFNSLPLADGGRFSGVTNATVNIAGVITNDGGNYFLVASNFVGVTTSSVAVLTPVILPPFFLVQPTSQSILAGSNVTFSAVVDGTPPYYYQWSFNGSPLADDARISGSATTSLSISNLTTADAGSYSLFVTNVVGATNSDAAVLTVLVPPSITLNPVGRSVPPGLPTTFNASASGIPTPTYQWQLNGTNVPGATSASHTIAAVNTTNLGFYHVVASNSVGVATSADAQLTFGPVAAWGRNLNNECLPPPGLSNVVAVAGAFGGSYAVRTDGTVAAWGSASITNLPASVSNVVAVATSGTGNCALRSDGRVVGWNGISVPALSNIVAVAAGNNFGYAVRAEGTLTNWGSIPTPGFPAGLNHLTGIAAGYNNAVALRNDGTIVVSGVSAVTNVPGSVTNVIAIAAGYTYAMALRADGKVIAWGSGTITNLPTSLTNIIAISAGNYSGENFGLAIRSNGRVVTFGDNTFSETNAPAALSNLVSIAGAAAPYHGLALVNDGSPVILHPPIGLTTYTGRDVTLHGDAVGASPLSYQWLLNGTNVPGATSTSLVISNVQLGNAGSYQLFVSNNVNTALSLAAPLTVISNNTLIILSQSTVSPTNLYQGGKGTISGVTVLGNGPLRYQWFFSRTNNNYAAVSGATNDTLVLDPALVINTGNYYVAVSNQFAGLTNPPAFLRVQFAKAWGYLATDPPTNLVVSNATAIAVGNAGQGSSFGHYLVLKSDGKISSWTAATSTAGETNFSSVSNSIITAIAAGYQDSLVLKSDGTVAAFGYNVYGETNVPAGLNGVTAIACGDYHDLALKADGSIVGWGQTTYLQTSNAAATNVVAIAAGGQSSMVLRADGTVFNWGANQFSVPFNATNVIAIACGSQHFLALRANGTVVGWGNNAYGQTTISTNLTNIVAIAAGANHSVLLRNDGTVATLGAYNGSTAITSPADLANVVAIAGSSDHDLALFGTRAPAFTVQPWNRAVTYSTTGVTNINLTGKCAGVQPMTYQWRLNGTNYPGATNDSLTLRGDPPGQIPTGTFQLVASNSYGVAVSKPAKVTLVIPLAVALDTTNLNWLTSGSAPWFGQTNITHDGVDAARSGGIGAGQETILQTTLGTNLPGAVTFWWKVSSEEFFDTLEFRVNGTVQAVISGEVDWQQASIPVAAGTNVLMWRYSKDGSFDSGFDAGFVDQFAFTSAPVINVQPAGVVANLGQTVSLSVSAAGVPQLGYQWRQNGNAVGGNSSVLTLNSVARAAAGTYSVIVTNAGGMAVSSNAAVIVHVPQILGTPALLPDGSLQLTSTDVNGGLLTPSDLPNFEAQASTNLVNWTTLPGALSLTNGMLQLQDSSRTNFTARYYRIVEH